MLQSVDKVAAKDNISAAVLGTAPAVSNTLDWHVVPNLAQQASQFSPALPTVFRLFGAVHAVRSGFETLPVGQLMLKRERGGVRMDN